MDELEEQRQRKRRDGLIGGFRAWLERSRSADEVEALVSDAETFLRWDCDYRKSSLTMFDPGDIDEYLLSWCPRKLSYPPEAWLGVVDALIAYLEFLAEAGQWRGPASQARAVAAHASRQTLAYLDAMADPSNYGMAKGMFMGPAFAGADIDVTDPASLQAAMDRFNSLPFEERKALTDGPLGATMLAQGAAERRARASFDMPPVRLPAQAAVEAAAAQSPLYRAVVGLRGYIGEHGVALTQKGNLKLVDCRALVDRLSTGDAFEYGPPGYTSAVRSMDELPQLSFLFDLALEAGATRRVKGRLVPVKRWRTEPVAAATELAEVAADLRYEGMHPWLDRIEEVVANGLPYLLAPAMGYGVGLSLEEMTEFACAAAAGTGPRPSWATDEVMEEVVGRSVQALMERMAFAGVVTIADEAVAMTAFGVQFMVGTMRSNGFNVPEVPSLERLSAEDLLATITDATVFAGAAALSEWQPEWTAERKCDELVDALLDVPVERRSAHQRYGAFALLGAAPTAAAEPALTRLLGTPYAGYAATALAGDDLPVPRDDAEFVEELDGVMDLTSVMLPWVDDCYLDITVDGAAAVVPLVRGLLDGTPPDVLETLALVPVREVADVMEAVGAVYPDKRVAKTARTVLHKWHSRWGR